MAQTLHPLNIAPTTTGASSGTASQVLLASCKASVCVLKNQQWEPVANSSVFRLQLVRHSQGNFLLLGVDEKAVAIKFRIILRYNTVFKVIKNNFFSLLDNGVTVWGFEIAGQTSDAQTFAVVVQNSLASLKELTITKSPKLASVAQPALAKQELKGDQQVYLNNICSTLSDAISNGNVQFASDLVRQLATHKASVRVKLEEPEKDELSMLTKDNKIHLKVQVEDKESAGVHFRLNISPQTTINQLKQMVQIKYDFPVEIQRWIIGKRIPKPSESLLDCGIRDSGQTLFLYLISAKPGTIAEPPPPEGRREREERRSAPPNRDGRQSETLNRANSDSSLEIASTEHQDPRVIQQDHVAAAALRNAVLSMPNLPSAQFTEAVPVAGWMCPQCTFLNSPTRPGCEMCSADRPANYQVPQDYRPSERERNRLDMERTGEMMIREEVVDFESLSGVRR